MRKFSEILKELRTSHNMTQRELAKKLGITVRMVAFLESGERGANLEIMAKTSDVFNCSVDYLFGRTNDPSEMTTQGYSNHELVDILRQAFVMFNGKVLTDADKEKVIHVVKILFDEKDGASD